MWSKKLTILVGIFGLVLSSCTNNFNIIGNDTPVVVGHSDATLILESIEVAPANQAILHLSTQQFTATGTYSDETTKDITHLVTWSPNAEDVATVDVDGLATGFDAGLATITATMGEISGAATLTVEIVLESITVTPDSHSIVQLATRQFTATGTYSDGSTQDVTSSVIWSSDTGTVATIDENGLVTSGDMGSSTIVATLGSVSGSTALIVKGGFTKLSGAAGATLATMGNVVDTSGNIYMTGSTSAALDGQAKTGTNDVYVMKYNSGGVKQWTRLLGGTVGSTAKLTYGYGITLDLSGNVYVSGRTEGNLGGETLTGTGDAFIIKYDADGTRLWVKLLGVAGVKTSATGIKTDPDGNVYISGNTLGNLAGETLTGTQDAILAKYAPDGTRLWVKLLGVATKVTGGVGITLDGSGNIYQAGQTSGNLGGQTVLGTNDSFVAKYDADGVNQWVKLSGAVGSATLAKAIVLDATGNIYVTGQTTGNLNGETLTGTYDAYVIKYDPDGIKLWTKLSGVAGVPTIGNGLALDSSSGSVYSSGSTDGNLNGETVTGTQDGFVIKYDLDGNKVWTKLFGVAGADSNLPGHTYGVTLDQFNNIYVVGGTKGNLDGQVLTGTQDAFITTRFNR